MANFHWPAHWPLDAATGGECVIIVSPALELILLRAATSGPLPKLANWPVAADQGAKAPGRQAPATSRAHYSFLAAVLSQLPVASRQLKAIVFVPK